MTTASNRQGTVLRRKWRRWIRRLRPEVQDLVVGQHIYETVAALLRDNTDACRHGDYHHWSVRNYAIKTTVSIRKLMDHDKRSISIRRLLEEIESYSRALTTQSHVSLFRQDMQPGANVGFEQYAGRGADHYPGYKAREDLDHLMSAHAAVRMLVNKRFAHLDARNIQRRPPTLGEVHEIIGLLEATINKYAFLLLADSEVSLLGTWQYDWTEIFTVPWKTERKWLAN